MLKFICVNICVFSDIPEETIVSVTLSVTEDVKKKMEQFSEINWSGFIRKTIVEKTKVLSWKEAMLQKAKEEVPILDWTVELQRRAKKDGLLVLQEEGADITVAGS